MLPEFLKTTFGSVVVTTSLIAAVAAVAAVASAQAPPAASAPRRVFLNGTAIDDVRGVELLDVRVSIDPGGNVYLEAPSYRVLRKPGHVPRIIRRAQAPATGRVFLVAQRKGQARTPFVVMVYANGKLLQTVDGAVARTTLEVTDSLFQGLNLIRFQVANAPQTGLDAFDPNGEVQISLGVGQTDSKVLAIDRVLLSYKRHASERGRYLEEHKLVVGK